MVSGSDTVIFCSSSGQNKNESEANNDAAGLVYRRVTR